MEPEQVVRPEPSSPETPIGRMLEGRLRRRDEHAAVLLVGHAAGRRLWGSERSLVDVLDGFLAIAMDVVVVLPPGVLDNSDYLEMLRDRSCAIHVESLPFRGVEQPDGGDSVVRRICEIIRQHKLEAVHVNTTVLREPLRAARQCGVPAILHAREIPTGDSGLCDLLKTTATSLISDILEEADFIVANSRATANAFPLSGRTYVVPNVIDCARFTPRSTSAAAAPRVLIAGTLSSKKGIELFRQLADRLAPLCDARFLAVGAATAITDQWVIDGLPQNMELMGYLPTPEEVMAHADIVVSMSIVQESFGRTIIEAMAAGLPVVSFDQGGPSEVIVDGETGTLVPPGDLDAFAAAVLALCRDADLRLQQGQAGRRRVETHYSPARLAQALAESYRVILPPAEVRSEALENRRFALPSENRSPFKTPFYVGCRARFAHCTDVAFLDDHTLVTASLLGRRMYLVEFDPETGACALISELPTTGSATEASIDLLDVDGQGRIVTADCEQQSITIYRRFNQVLVREQSYPVPAGGFCHGACFMPGDSDLVAVSVTTGDVGVHLFSLASGGIQGSIRLSGWRPKSAAFLAPDRLLAAWARDNISQLPGANHDSLLTVLAVSQPGSAAEVVCSLPLPGRSVDGLRVLGDRVFETDQIGDRVNEWRVGDAGFQLERTYAGFSFPHGVGVSPCGDWLAVAEYGTNAMAVRRRHQVRRARSAR